jgi:hypothetical protein
MIPPDYLLLLEKKYQLTHCLKQSSIDNGFKAKYLILKKVYGNFPKDTIEFVLFAPLSHETLASIE